MDESYAKQPIGPAVDRKYGRPVRHTNVVNPRALVPTHMHRLTHLADSRARARLVPIDVEPETAANLQKHQQSMRGTKRRVKTKLP